VRKTCADCRNQRSHQRCISDRHARAFCSPSSSSSPVASQSTLGFPAVQADQPDAQPGGAPALSGPDLSSSDAVKHVFTVQNFLSEPLASSLRGTYDEKFANPCELSGARFCWDYWHVPGQYTQMRTPAQVRNSATFFQPVACICQFLGPSFTEASTLGQHNPLRTCTGAINACSSQ
jgi:hypothetical protein